MGGLLIFMAYIIHKMFKDRREAGDLTPKSPRSQDDATFAMAAMQGVIARLKQQETELVELRRAAEKRARESAQISENIIREMPNGLLVFNREGFITTVNPAARALLGVDTWSRRRYPEILGRGSALTRYLEECLETGKGVAQEMLEHTTESGQTRVLGVSLSPLHGANGEVEGAICLFTDLTEVQRLQEQVRLKEHLAALGGMSAGIAHELKNALATISGYAQLLRDSNLSEENREFARKIVSETRSLTRVVTDFLTISKPMNLTARPVNVEELFRQAMEDLQRVEPFREVTFALEGAFVPVAGDEVLLRQAISNLLRNSCEAMGGREGRSAIVVRGEMARQADRDFSKIQVRDNGPGIPPEDREKVFLPFFTTKPEGSGLGLALVQKIVVSHDGSITLESGSSQGACFSILLPVRQDPPRNPVGGISNGRGNSL